MKVLKDNYNSESYVYEFAEPYPRKVVCEECMSELEYDESDIRMGTYGCMYLDCPLCGCDILLDDNEHNLKLTKDNVQFPLHFHHTSKDTGAVDTCHNEYVKQLIKEGVESLRYDKEGHACFSGSGNTMVFVFRFDEDEDYQVFVTNDYYSTYIPFESEDYDGRNNRYAETYQICEEKW